MHTLILAGSTNYLLTYNVLMPTIATRFMYSQELACMLKKPHRKEVRGLKHVALTKALACCCFAT